MNFKKFLALLLVFAMVFSFAACKKTEKKEEGGTFKVVIWVPEAAVELTKKQVEDFNKNNEYGITIQATVDPLSESESATQVLNDVNTAADMFFFAQDQFARLVRGGALAEVPEEMVKNISDANNAGVVAAAKSGDKLYAYPLTNDNGYFMYYDKSVIPESDVGSLEKLIADCEKAGKYFDFEMQSSAWYLASFFFGAGCHSEWVTDDEGNFISIDDDFNSDKGLIAVKGMQKLVQSDMHRSSSDAAGFNNGAAIVVTGTWAYEDIKGMLKDNLGAAELPSFNVDGKDYHLGSFSGCKLLGVKAQKDPARQAALHHLAEYLTSEAAQLERFNELSWGPANTKAAENEAVLANPGLVALNAQNKYATPQGQIEGSWWDIAKVIGAEVKEASSEADLKQALKNYDDKISAVFNKTDDQKNAYSVIGSICGTSWDTDFPMTEKNGEYVSDELELHAGEEFKFRKGGSWDVNFGSDGNLNGPNFVIEQSGKYVLHLKPAADESSAEFNIELIEAIEDEDNGEEEPGEDTWGVIGAICGTNWDTDFAMTEVEEGVWESEALELKAGDELKCRKNADWGENFPAENVVVETDGTYIVVLNVAEGTVTLKEAG